tara:strand:+ start:6743 stop:6898 length:156 start_codon:yes stop_codon:yes gene_type:complete
MIPKSIVERRPEPKKFKVGPIESDSGNHFLDIFSVIVGLALLIMFKKMVGK